MAIFVFALSFMLLAAGFASAYLSLDLIPTSLGVLYALAGAVAISIALLAFALGVAIRRLEALAVLVRRSEAPPAAESPQGEKAHRGPTFVDDVSEATAEAEAVVEPRELVEDAEAPINENRAGHLPTFGAIKGAPEMPGPPPDLVGRYSAGGASYMIFSDGSIEAETTDGTFKFASIGEFKQFLADRRGGPRWDRGSPSSGA
jgi:hypothetical protein